jgi:hypothetical protein
MVGAEAPARTSPNTAALSFVFEAMVNHPAVAIRFPGSAFIGFRPAAFEIQIGEVSGGTKMIRLSRNKIPVQTVKPVIGPRKACTNQAA